MDPATAPARLPQQQIEPDIEKTLKAQPMAQAEPELEKQQC